MQIALLLSPAPAVLLAIMLGSRGHIGLARACGLAAVVLAIAIQMHAILFAGPIGFRTLETLLSMLVLIVVVTWSRFWANRGDVSPR